MAVSEPGYLAVLLHGVGGQGRDMLPLERLLSRKRPHIAFLAPDAPFEAGPGNAREWFSLTDIDADSRPGRVEAARPFFDQVLETAIGSTLTGKRLILIGFSQGATMALDAALTGRWPAHSVIALSGRLGTAKPWSSAPASTLIIHGDGDEVVPPDESRWAYAALRSQNIQADLHIVPGVGHGIAPEVSALVRQEIDRIAPPEHPTAS